MRLSALLATFYNKYIPQRSWFRPPRGVRLRSETGHIDLEVIAKDMYIHTARLNEISGRHPKEDAALEMLVSRCEGIIKDPLEVLDQLKRRPNDGKWKSFRQALKSQWRDSHIENLRSRLNDIATTVNANLAAEDDRSIISLL